MPINVLNTGPSLGGNLGQALGTGLSSGLDSLAQAKMQNLQKQQRAQGISSILGVDPQQAQAYASLPDPLLQTIFKQHMQNQSQQQFENNVYGNQAAPQQNQYQQMQQQQPEQRLNPFNALQGLRKSFPNAPIPSQEQVQQRIPQQQQPQQVQTAPMTRPIPRGLTPQQYNQFVGHQEKQQAAANSTNKKYLDQLGESVPTAERMIGLIDEMEALQQTGKVATGLKGKYVPLWLQNPETQEYAAKANELATLISDNARGRPSAFRLKIVQTTKPSIEQALLAQKGLQNSVREQALKTLGTRDIIDNIIQQNGGYQPANISSLVNQQKKLQQPETAHQERQSASPIGSIPQEEQTQEETPLGTIGRGIVRTGSRIGEALATNLGDIASTGLGAANYLTGGAVPTYEDIQKKLPISPPTSAQAQEFSEKATGGYTAPQGEAEKFIDNVVSTATKLIGGAGIPHLTKALSAIFSPKNAAAVAKLVLPFAGVSWQKGLGLSLAGETGAKTAETLGAGPTGQLASKFAFMLAAQSPFIKNSATSAMQKAYSQSDAAAAGKNINIGSTNRQLRNLYKDVVNGASPNKEIVKGIIGDTTEALERAATSPSGNALAPRTQTGLDKLLRLKKDVNEWYTKADRPQVRGEKHLPVGSRKYIADLNRIISEPINEYAKSHPEFGKPYALAEDLYRGIKDVDFINKWIDKHSSTSLSFKTFAPKLLTLGAAGSGISHVAELTNMFIKHPATRLHYLEAIKAATQGNVNSFKKHEREFDKEAKKIHRQSP